MNEIEKVLEVATAEIGYLEKKSNSMLYDKTANAGSGNYTKYWADIEPSYQGQPWCAAFVTWCLETALGAVRAKYLLKHYPFVYCPTLAAKGKADGQIYTVPKTGDVVLFYRNGTYAHTGIVVSASGSAFTTIEGNTSGGSTIVANGGGVCKKTYNINNLPGTVFYSPTYNIESGELTVTQYEELKAAIAAKDEIINTMGAEIAALKTVTTEKMIYNYIDDNMPEWAKQGVQWCVDNGIIEGTGEGLGLDDKDLKYCTIIKRLFDLVNN